MTPKEELEQLDAKQFEIEVRRAELLAIIEKQKMPPLWFEPSDKEVFHADFWGFLKIPKEFALEERSRALALAVILKHAHFNGGRRWTSSVFNWHISYQTGAGLLVDHWDYTQPDPDIPYFDTKEQAQAHLDAMADNYRIYHRADILEGK